MDNIAVDYSNLVFNYADGKINLYSWLETNTDHEELLRLVQQQYKLRSIPPSTRLSIGVIRTIVASVKVLLIAE